MISDPIEFELFKNSLFSIADEMALTIFRTTYSGVLKDNMDYSTAMFDASGKLAAQGLTLPSPRKRGEGARWPYPSLRAGGEKEGPVAPWAFSPRTGSVGMGG
jgi:hypothetical protein